LDFTNLATSQVAIVMTVMKGEKNGLSALRRLKGLNEKGATQVMSREKNDQLAQ